MIGKKIIISATVYNLFLNLLLVCENDYYKVLFVLYDTIPNSICSNIKNKIVLHKDTKYIKLQKFFCCFLSKLFYGKTIYAQDHIPSAKVLIGKNKYSLVEDAPDIFHIICGQKYVIDSWENMDKTSHKVIRLNYVGNGIYGRNSQCDEVIVTNPYVPNYIKTKKIQLVSLSDLWENATLSKKAFILNVFNITQDEINILKKKTIILFTQPFSEDGDISEDEKIEIYESIVSNYDSQQIIIKTHPRETTNYKECFPGVTVFSKPIPFQLLNLLGIKFLKAITVCSTAVNGIPYNIKIDWIGAKIHPKLYKQYGNYNPIKNE